MEFVAHLRNMDWEMEALRPCTLHLRFVREVWARGWAVAPQLLPRGCLEGQLFFDIPGSSKETGAITYHTILIDCFR
jgi:hypothetical protein